MAFAGKPFRDPLDIMLEEQTLIEPGAVAISPGITPSVEEIAACTPTAASMPARLLGRGAVIDNPDLAELRTAENELIQVRVIGHGVHVHPVRIDGHTFLPGRSLCCIELRWHWFRSRIVVALNVVQIDPFRMVGYLAVIGFGPVAVLDEVIPASPFPND